MKPNEGLANLLDAILDVKSLADIDAGVEETRPRACYRCGVGAGCVGSLRIHGHGTRPRDAWGPPSAVSGAAPEIVGLRLRRYRCVDCRHVMTVRPRLLGRYFRYTAAAIALALWLWAVAGRSASAVRHEVSPWPIRGLCEAHRWRSVSRWLARLDDLYGLPKDLGETGRGLARRAVHLMAARAPPELAAQARAFVGAQLR